jgi:hypothetical protein
MRAITLFTLLAFATCIFIAPISAQAMVEFEGTVITDETVSFPVCYEMHHCEVRVDTILTDPNNTLTIGQNVTICYLEAINLTAGDQVRCHGDYWVIGGCPFQFCGHVTCTEIMHMRYDMNFDKHVGIEDIIIAALAFGAHPDHPRWNSQADVDHDSIVSIIDLCIIANQFGTTYQ